jgi:hypothetical protein
MPIRTFSMNSPEFYEAMCGPPDPWRWGPGLPKQPRARDPEVIVDGEGLAGAVALPAARSPAMRASVPRSRS